MRGISQWRGKGAFGVKFKLSPQSRFPPRFRHAVFARCLNPRFFLYASGGEFQADRDNQASHIFAGKKKSEVRKKTRGSKRRVIRRHIGNLRDCGGGRRAYCAYGGRFRQGTAIRRIFRISCGFEKAEVNGEIARALREMRRRCGNLPRFPSCGRNGFGGEQNRRKFLKSGGRTIRKIRFMAAAENGRGRSIALFNCLTKFSLRKLDIFKNRFHKY